MKKSWLVTGGAGYIGSHVARALNDAQMHPVVVDDLSSGHREFVAPDVPFVEGSILDTELLSRTMHEHQVVGVIHLAGFKYAGVSVELGPQGDELVQTALLDVVGSVKPDIRHARRGSRH